MEILTNEVTCQEDVTSGTTKQCDIGLVRVSVEILASAGEEPGSVDHWLVFVHYSFTFKNVMSPLYRAFNSLLVEIFLRTALMQKFADLVVHKPVLILLIFLFFFPRPCTLSSAEFSLPIILFVGKQISFICKVQDTAPHFHTGSF